MKIVVENPKVLNYRCTGKFKDQDGVEHVLKVIQKDHSFIYSISAEKDSIFIKQRNELTLNIYLKLVLTLKSITIMNNSQ